MKTIVKSFVLIVVTVSSLLTACVSKYNLAASKTRVKELNKDNVATHNEQNKKLAHLSTSSKTIRQQEHFTPLPPFKVDSVFKAHYRYATEILWATYKPQTHSEANCLHEYQVHFLLQGKKESVVYTEDGKMIEVRSEILPYQLPEIVYEAIKNKYAEEQIVGAYAITNIYSDGSYVAVLKSKTQSTAKELIVSEKGLVVK